MKREISQPLKEVVLENKIDKPTDPVMEGPEPFPKTRP